MMKNISFDEKTIIEIGAYVYALFDPTEKRPFYIGKGRGNRIFQHVEGAIKEDKKSNKYEKIREIRARDSNNRVSHCVIRHGMSDKVAFEVESALIDLANMTGANLTNEVTGHNAIENGIMLTDDIIWKYNAQPLNDLLHSVVIINISKSYKTIRDDAIQGNTQYAGKDLIYESVKQAWRIGPNRENAEYVLAEYKGIIVEVYEVIEVKNNDGKLEKWYPCPKYTPIRWGFHGRRAPDQVRGNYVNKSIAHHKKPGSSNPIRYSLNY
jgi:hypothetical protein|tara:strand:- start:151 stop:951 length:801 start_codon:yes stop_codon:yes gene_type:complete